MGLYDRDYMKDDYPDGGGKPPRPSFWTFIIAAVVLLSILLSFIALRS
jgi:hypothetical protein